MAWLIKDFNYTNEAFAYAVDCFTDDEIKQIIEFAQEGRKGQGELENGSSNLDIRSSTISWIDVCDKTIPLYQKLTGLVSELNDRFFKFDLTEMESLQYTEYHSETKDRYKSHSDDGYNFNLFRKLSFSVQLSDPKDYEGGELKFYRNTLLEPSVAPKTKGTIIAFPSYVIHEVTPVTQGLRKSLVSWVVGPRFR